MLQTHNILRISYFDDNWVCAVYINHNWAEAEWCARVAILMMRSVHKNKLWARRMLWYLWTLRLHTTHIVNCIQYKIRGQHQIIAILNLILWTIQVQTNSNNFLSIIRLLIIYQAMAFSSMPHTKEFRKLLSLFALISCLVDTSFVLCWAHIMQGVDKTHSAGSHLVLNCSVFFKQLQFIPCHLTNIRLLSFGQYENR